MAFVQIKLELGSSTVQRLEIAVQRGNGSVCRRKRRLKLLPSSPHLPAGDAQKRDPGQHQQVQFDGVKAAHPILMPRSAARAFTSGHTDLMLFHEVASRAKLMPSAAAASPADSMDEATAPSNVANAATAGPLFDTLTSAFVIHERTFSPATSMS